MEIITDSIKIAFDALSDNKDYLVKEAFVKNMKKHQVSLFTGLSPDMPDYESCCEELYQALLSQCESNPSPKPSFHLKESNPFVSNELLNDLPDYLRFVGESKENPFGTSNEVLPPQQLANSDTLTIEQFRELYEKSLLVKSIVEGIVESKGATDNKRKTIADKIIEFMQENPGRPSYEMTIGKRTDKGKSVNKRYDNKSAWVSESKEGSAEMVKIVEEESQDGKLIASANKEEAKIGPDRRQQEYDEITEDTKENTRVEDSAYKMHKEDNEEVTNPEAQYEDYRVSDVLEESKDKRIARTECVKGRGLHINPFRQVAKKVQNLPERQKIRREIIKQAPRGGINIENSITDVSCNYFVTSKLNKMCDYIAQNTDCSIF